MDRFDRKSKNMMAAGDNGGGDPFDYYDAPFLKRLVPILGGKWFVVPFMLGLLVFTAPMTFYGALRMRGTIDPAIWHSNHGPWANNACGDIVFYPEIVLLLLVPVMLIIGFVAAIRKKSWWFLLRGVVFAFLMFLLFVTLYAVTAWTVT